MKIKKSQKKQILNIAFVLLLAGLTFLMLYLSSNELNADSLYQFFLDCNIWLILAAVGCMLLYSLLEALALHFILHKFGQKPKLRSSLAYSTSDVYYSGITPSATGGQPASAFYMLRDGIPGGTATFALILNLVAYTAALLLIGVLVLIFNFSMFLEFSLWVKLFVIAGFVAQLTLLILFIACFRRPGAVMKIGNFFITLLVRIHIIKKEQKWRDKLSGVVQKYSGCFEWFQKQHGVFVRVLAINILQRTALIMVSVLVCASVVDYSMFDLFAMQTFATIGYNSIPLPGGSGAYEFLYLNIYERDGFTAEIVMISMMVTRVISYYLSILVNGIYTMIYHMLPSPSAPASTADTATAPIEETTSTEKDGTQNEEA